ncbi:hypothetical protein AYO44_06535 [Planctomycetaceae bacterium SCGC AG-212-F19]|nr:hypothetical protein AYO44_06535 [Planctomycetaceae bacterium SCGC AG-212-F19]
MANPHATSTTLIAFVSRITDHLSEETGILKPLPEDGLQLLAQQGHLRGDLEDLLDRVLVQVQVDRAQAQLALLPVQVGGEVPLGLLVEPLALADQFNPVVDQVPRHLPLDLHLGRGRVLAGLQLAQLCPFSETALFLGDPGVQVLLHLVEAAGVHGGLQQVEGGRGLDAAVDEVLEHPAVPGDEQVALVGLGGDPQGRGGAGLLHPAVEEFLGGADALEAVELEVQLVVGDGADQQVLRGEILRLDGVQFHVGGEAGGVFGREETMGHDAAVALDQHQVALWIAVDLDGHLHALDDQAVHKRVEIMPQGLGPKSRKPLQFITLTAIRRSGRYRT